MKGKHILKRLAALAVAMTFLLSLASCGKKQAQTQPATLETTQPPTTQPTIPETTAPAPTEPEWELGTALAAHGEALVDTLAKGTRVDVLGQYLDYYVIAGEEYDLLVEKRFVRLETEDPFESIEAYARYGAKVFSNVYLRDEPIATLSLNARITLLEAQGDWVYISWTGGEGYLDAQQYSKYYINGGGGGSSGGGGGGGGANDGTDVNIGNLSGDGMVTGGITLLGTYYGPEMEPDFTPCAGTVLADGVERYLLLWERGDALKVTASDDTTCTIWIEDEIYVTAPRYLVRLETQEAYTSWTGYVRYQAEAYWEYQLRNSFAKPNVNTEVTVLDEIGKGTYSYAYPGCYLVELNGELCYMKLDHVSTTRVVTGGGGGSSGGGGGGGDTWTPPQL